MFFFQFQQVPVECGGFLQTKSSRTEGMRDAQKTLLGAFAFLESVRLGSLLNDCGLISAPTLRKIWCFHSDVRMRCDAGDRMCTNVIITGRTAAPLSRDVPKGLWIANCKCHTPKIASLLNIEFFFFVFFDAEATWCFIVQPVVGTQSRFVDGKPYYALGWMFSSPMCTYIGIYSKEYCSLNFSVDLVSLKVSTLFWLSLACLGPRLTKGHVFGAI